MNVGIFPCSSTISTAQPCFWKATLSIIRRRINSGGCSLYSTFFSDIIQAIPSAMTQQAIIGSLLSSLKKLPFSLDPSPSQRAIVKQEANLLCNIVGRLDSKSHELWENIFAIILTREWNEDRGRFFVCWTAGAGIDDVDKDTAGYVHLLYVPNISLNKFPI